MAESESNSHLTAPGDGDVERLLREAESLTREVARETGTPIRDADALLSGDLTAPPDPLAAVDAASASIMSLEDLLGEMGPGDPTGEVLAPPRSMPLSPRPAAPASATRASAGAAAVVAPVKSKPLEIAGTRYEPRMEHQPTEEEAYSPPGDITAVQPASGPGESNGSARKQDTPKLPQPPLGRRILQLPRSAGRGLRTAVMLIVRDVPIGLLTSFDIPFQRTPRSVKNAIGIIGGITLMMGALAWALPGLMRPKPASPGGAALAEAPASNSGHLGEH